MESLNMSMKGGFAKGDKKSRAEFRLCRRGTHKKRWGEKTKHVRIAQELKGGHESLEAIQEHEE